MTDPTTMAARSIPSRWLRAALSLLAFGVALAPSFAAERGPNIVLIVADDLGYGALGCYGQTKILTPNIDRLAAEGMRFTQFYAGSSLCAPSRSALMTGMHTGHTPIRANGENHYLYDSDVTVAEVLKRAGYSTGGFGKWGLGDMGTPGVALRQGFDEWFGFYHHVHAHFYYPYWMWRNDTKFALPGNDGRKRAQYSHDEIQNQALGFIRRHWSVPFFCYLPYTIPHFELTVPADSEKPYQGKFPKEIMQDPASGYLGSDDAYATYAGMVSRLDRSVGQVMDALKDLGLDRDTLVLFSSDNGAQGGGAWQKLIDFFDATGGLRGSKGSWYEGGIRVPLIARWPGKIKAGSVTAHLGAFWDVMPTLAAIAGTDPPETIDGISFVPTLLGAGPQRTHEILYWEMPGEGGYTQAARIGDWKAVRPRPHAPLELYDLKDDPKETSNLADKEPALLDRIWAAMASAYSPERIYPAEEHPPGVKDFVR